MTKETICEQLGNHPWRDHLIFLETVDSTNTYLKRLAAQGAPEGTCVAADQQTGGRGRRGRSFSSPKGQGIYLSVLLRPQTTPEHLLHATCVAAVAVRRAIFQACGLQTQIKWINDLVCEKKKLCGILTEVGVTSTGAVDYLICGIGINCTQQPEDFPPEVAPMATSIGQMTGFCDRSALTAALLVQMAQAGEALLTDPGPWMADYRSNCITLGQEVQLIRSGEVRRAYAEGLDDQGALLVMLPDGTRETVFSGEVSVRGMYGYL